MDDEQYDKAYGDAREALNRRGKKVGRQTLRPDGARYSIIDGCPLTDDQIREGTSPLFQINGHCLPVGIAKPMSVRQFTIAFADPDTTGSAAGSPGMGRAFEAVPGSGLETMASSACRFASIRICE